jgi:D-amino peptidase
MKVFISVDLEGISGIVQGEQTRPEGRDYERSRKLMTGEANAAISGAFEAGASEVVVNDSHGPMRNLIPEELHENAKLITGSLKALSMMQGIERGFDAVFLVGYHARRGTLHAILDHTYSGATVSSFVVNGQEYGETGMNAAIAGYYDVPVVLVTGDSSVTSEAKGLLGNVETVTVKEAVSRRAAKCLHPNKAREAIRQGAILALRRRSEIRPFKLKPPFELRVELMDAGMADAAELVPNVKRIAPRVVAYTSDDFVTVSKAFRSIVTLASSTIER